MNSIQFNHNIITQKQQELDFLHHFYHLDYDIVDLSVIEEFDWTQLSQDDLSLMEKRHKWQHNGSILALRSDWTHAIARYRQKYHLNAKKIAYAGPIYTLREEKYQLGLETFTENISQQMTLMIQMVNYIQESLSVSLSVAVISHNTLLQNLLSEEELNDDLTRKFIKERNPDALKAKLGANHPIINLMAQPVKEQPHYVKTHFPHLKRHIEEIEEWKEQLKKKNIPYVYGDMLALPSRSYYKGIFIQLYTQQNTEPIASGGQYSSPSKAFGMGLNI